MRGASKITVTPFENIYEHLFASKASYKWMNRHSHIRKKIDPTPTLPKQKNVSPYLLICICCWQIKKALQTYIFA